MTTPQILAQGHDFAFWAIGEAIEVRDRDGNVLRTVTGPAADDIRTCAQAIEAGGIPQAPAEEQVVDLLATAETLH